MATKAETIAAALKGEGCLGKAADDEPVFVLRAQDMHACSLVLQWAKWNRRNAPEKAEEAYKHLCSDA